MMSVVRRYLIGEAVKPWVRQIVLNGRFCRVIATRTKGEPQGSVFNSENEE